VRQINSFAIPPVSFSDLAFLALALRFSLFHVNVLWYAKKTQSKIIFFSFINKSRRNQEPSHSPVDLRVLISSDRPLPPKEPKKQLMVWAGAIQLSKVPAQQHFLLESSDQ
jgi:hypothetical protein